MLLYQPQEIQRYLQDLLSNQNISIEPIGNHELGRHLVYRVNLPGEAPLVFKLYCKKNRRLREIAALQRLEESQVKCARMKAVGMLADGTEWLLSTFISGIVLDRVWEQMNDEQEQHMFELLGDELGKIHSAATYPFFGHWDENGNSLYKLKHYFSEFVRSSEYVFRHIEAQQLPDWRLLEKAIYMIRRNYSLVSPIRVSRLTHHDYDGRNILVQQEGKQWNITGVLDFEQSFPGNCEIDLAGIYARYLMGATHREDWFLNGYQRHLPVDKDFWRRLPYYLLCKGVVICSWTNHQAPDYYQEGLHLIQRFYSLVEDEQ
ncbi:phosphotransferase family protein [Anoxynatronum sibiricum]|uniref:Phosphotransferase n=1 Tax=Anoxynatronum sibiricum TaxID=210623 RepID=A0ABU9VR15_9CLOT